MDKPYNDLDYLVPIISGIILFGLLLAFVIYFILVFRKTQTTLDFERERIKTELLRVENEVKEQTLTNVSRELHDNFGQIASLIKINLNMISKDLASEDLEKVEESLSLVKQLIGDIKSLSSSLNGDQIRQLGWLEVVKNEVERVNKTGVLTIKFVVENWWTLSHEKEVILFRMVQEMMNNTLKHAQATTAELRIEASSEQTKIEFSDNGIGFNLMEVKRGNGLINIQERCKIIEANLDFSSNEAMGTKICIILTHQ
jgi:two-component system NarL family sensor kinase